MVAHDEEGSGPTESRAAAGERVQILPRSLTAMPMATRIDSSKPTLIIRRPAYERAGLVRSALDERLGLTEAEFRVDGNLVIIGPIHDAAGLPDVIAELEDAGLAYFDDFFEAGGNWPDWLGLVVLDA
jgi:hypothetical protein